MKINILLQLPLCGALAAAALSSCSDKKEYPRLPELQESSELRRRADNVKERGQEALDQGLIVACRRRWDDMACALLARGANINARSESDGTPLMAAASSGDLNLVRILLENGAEVNARKESGWTALMSALDSAKLPCITYLLKHGADASLRRKADEKPGQLLQDIEFKDCALGCFSIHADFSKVQNAPELVIALQKARGGHSAAALAKNKLYDKLVGQLPAEDIYGKLAPLYALRCCANGDASCMRKILRHGQLQPDNKLLYNAVRGGHPEITKLLLEAANEQSFTLNGPEPDNAAASLAQLLTHGRSKEAGRILELCKGQKVSDELLAAALNCGVAQHDTALLQALLPLLEGRDKKTACAAMLEAAKQNDVASAKLLQSAGIPTDSKRADGWTSLMTAAWYGQREMLEFLLQNASDPQARKDGESGWTALTSACYQGHGDIARLLQEKGARFADEGDKDKMLYFAASAGWQEEAEKLLATGAKPNTIFWKDNALSRALEHGDKGMIRLLLRHNARYDSAPDINAHAALASGDISLLTDCLDELEKSAANGKSANVPALILELYQNGRKEDVRKLLGFAFPKQCRLHPSELAGLGLSTEEYEELLSHDILVLEREPVTKLPHDRGDADLWDFLHRHHLLSLTDALRFAESVEDWQLYDKFSEQESDTNAVVPIPDQLLDKTTFQHFVRAAASHKVEKADEDALSELIRCGEDDWALNLLAALPKGQPLPQSLEAAVRNNNSKLLRQILRHSPMSNIAAIYLLAAGDPEHRHLCDLIAKDESNADLCAFILSTLPQPYENSPLSPEQKNGIAYLLKLGVARHDSSLMQRACRLPDPWLLQNLLAHGQDVRRVAWLCQILSDLPEQIILDTNTFRNKAELLLEKGADINSKDENGHTVLDYALSCRNSEICSYLRSKGAQGSVENGEGSLEQQAFLALDRYDNIGLSELLEKGLSANCRREDNWTLLHLACFNNNLEAVELLIRHHADVNAEDNNNWTVLMEGCRHGSKEIAEALLQAGARLNKSDNDGWNALMSAFSGNHLDTAQMLLERNANAKCSLKDGRTPLMEAALRGSIPLMQEILRRGVPINSSDKNGHSALDYAQRAGKQEAVEFLRQNGGHSSNGVSLQMMIDCCRERNAARLREYLLRGGDANAADNNGWSLLMESCRYADNLDILRALVEYKADINAQDINGWSAILCLCGGEQTEQLQMLGYLIEQGGDVNQASRYGITPLIQASKLRKLETIRMLTEHGADINARDASGCSAIDIARMNGFKEIQQFLESRK